MCQFGLRITLTCSRREVNQQKESVGRQANKSFGDLVIPAKLVERQLRCHIKEHRSTLDADNVAFTCITGGGNI